MLEIVLPPIALKIPKLNLSKLKSKSSCDALSTISKVPLAVNACTFSFSMEELMVYFVKLSSPLIFKLSFPSAVLLIFRLSIVTEDVG